MGPRRPRQQLPSCCRSRERRRLAGAKLLYGSRAVSVALLLLPVPRPRLVRGTCFTAEARRQPRWHLAVVGVVQAEGTCFPAGAPAPPYWCVETVVRAFRREFALRHRLPCALTAVRLRRLGASCFSAAAPAAAMLPPSGGRWGYCSGNLLYGSGRCVCDSGLF